MTSSKLARILLLAACLAMSCQKLGLEPGLVADQGMGHDHGRSELIITAITDTTLMLSWPAIFDHPHSHYVVSFREVHAIDYMPIALTDERHVIHNPHGKTGWYRVTLPDQFDDRPIYSGSTVPVHSQAAYVSELNALGLAGCGWESPDRIAGVWPMYEPASAEHVDLYVTNFKPYWSPPYYIASPHIAPQDRGLGVPPAPWNTTRVSASPLLDEDAPLPRVEPGNYGRATQISRTPLTLGLYTNDGYFAVVKVVETNVAEGYVRVESWFQRVQGLRLVAH